MTSIIWIALHELLDFWNEFFQDGYLIADGVQNNHHNFAVQKVLLKGKIFIKTDQCNKLIFSNNESSSPFFIPFQCISSIVLLHAPAEFLP